MSDLDALLAAYNDTPDDWSLVLGLADVFLEVDDERGADCCRWLEAKRRHPERHGDAFYGSPTANWWRGGNKTASLPKIVAVVYDTYYGCQWQNRGDSAVSGLLERLLFVWRRMPVADLVSAWEWQPPETEVTVA